MICSETAAADLYLSSLNLKLISRAGRRRQGVGRGHGARLPAALAGAPVTLEVLTVPGPEGRADPVTPLGYKTARRSLPRALARLAPDDPRRRVALMLADTVERVGSVGGVALDPTSRAHKVGTPDGGATTKIKHVARLRRLEAIANGWPITRTGAITRGRPRILAAPIRRTGDRQEIKAFPVLIALCVDGLSAAEILRRNGWPVKSRYQKRILDGALEVLDEVAQGVGL